MDPKTVLKMFYADFKQLQGSCRAKAADEEDAGLLIMLCITCKVDLPAALASK